jgi:Ca2+-binding EF-hand superfamily protein
LSIYLSVNKVSYNYKIAMAEESGAIRSSEIKEIFLLFDKNSDGFVHTSELGTVVRAINLNPTESEIQDMMKKVDPNQTG